MKESVFKRNNYFTVFLEFFVYSNLFIAVCAVLMSDQAFRFLLKRNSDYNYIGFIFFSTLTSYSFHWFLTVPSVHVSDRISWLQKFRPVHLTFLLASLIGSLIFFIPFIKYWPWFLVAIVATFLYSAPKIPHNIFRSLRKFALGKTIFLAFIWMYASTILPIIISEVAWTVAFTLFVISRFFLVYAICILFDYRDREDDQAAGIRSLITFLNDKGIKALFIGSILVFIACTLLLLTYYIALINVVILLIPGLITLGLYQYARTHYSDLFYYLVLDGLMALSSIIMLVAGI